MRWDGFRKRPLEEAADSESGRLLGGLRDALDHAHDIALLHDEELFAVELDLGAGPLAEQDAIAGLEIERRQLAVLVATARADRQHFAFLRLFLGRVGDDDAPLGLLFRIDAPDHDAVVKRTELHELSSLLPDGERLPAAFS